ncbi:protein-L-isoaspartate(D-aspartate) O-methyltransferase [Planctomycetota bacterium]
MAVDYDALRERMVRTQIEARGIASPRVLAAMRKVPRHVFVPSRYLGRAYDDTPLPIGREQTISQPYIVALMTEAASIEPDDRLLEVGTGCGYQAAILAELGRELMTIERIAELAGEATDRLMTLGHDNAKVCCGDGYLGLPDDAPFDAIVVTCAATEVPAPLVDQLSQGAKLVVPVGPIDRTQVLVVVEKRADGSLVENNLGAVRFVPLLRS